jgi:hypothetical protein
MSIFKDLDFGGLQEILFPVISALGGPDVRAEISRRAAVFHEAADVLEEAADVLRMGGSAVEDGILTNDEVNGIVAAAPSVAQAINDLFAEVVKKKSE